jgi:hypothetical protein
MTEIPDNLYAVAKVKLIIGETKTNRFIRQAGLGIEGVGIEHVYEIKYKPGEQVDEGRVESALSQVNEAMQADGKIELLKYEVLEIFYRPATAESP